MIQLEKGNLVTIRATGETAVVESIDGDRLEVRMQNDAGEKNALAQSVSRAEVDPVMGGLALDGPGGLDGGGGGALDGRSARP